MIEAEVKEITKPTFDLEVEVNLPKTTPKINHNLGDLKQYALELKDFYSKLIIEEKDIKDAENEKAKLNKLIEQVKRLRIDKVKEYKLPINDFESTAKEVESILGEASDTIKFTLDKFDDERKNDKRDNVIKPILNNAISQAFIKGHLINPDMIEENSKWYNKTFKESDIAKEIEAQIEEIIKDEESLNQGIEVIKSNIKMANNDKLNEAMYIERFKHSRDLTAVLNDISNDNNNVSRETLKEEDDPFSESFIPSDIEVVSFKGDKVQIEQLRAYAQELGMEEI